jgi:hypothetical protein
MLRQYEYPNVGNAISVERPPRRPVDVVCRSITKDATRRICFVPTESGKEQLVTIDEDIDVYGRLWQHYCRAFPPPSPESAGCISTNSLSATLRGVLQPLVYSHHSLITDVEMSSILELPDINFRGAVTISREHERYLES